MSVPWNVILQFKDFRSQCSRFHLHVWIFPEWIALIFSFSPCPRSPFLIRSASPGAPFAPNSSFRDFFGLFQEKCTASASSLSTIWVRAPAAPRPGPTKSPASPAASPAAPWPGRTLPTPRPSVTHRSCWNGRWVPASQNLDPCSGLTQTKPHGLCGRLSPFPAILI